MPAVLVTKPTITQHSPFFSVGTQWLIRQIRRIYLHKELVTIFTTITVDTSINAEKLIVLSSTSVHINSSETSAQLFSWSACLGVGDCHVIIALTIYGIEKSIYGAHSIHRAFQ